MADRETNLQSEEPGGKGILIIKTKSQVSKKRRDRYSAKNRPLPGTPKGQVPLRREELREAAARVEVQVRGTERQAAAEGGEKVPTTAGDRSINAPNLHSVG